MLMQKDNRNDLPKEADLSKGEFTSIILASLKGISQVIFIENVVSGVLILIAITIASYELGIIALLLFYYWYSNRKNRRGTKK